MPRIRASIRAKLTPLLQDLDAQWMAPRGGALKALST